MGHMRLLMLTSSLKHSDGWGRYSLGFISEARKRYGDDSVTVLDPRVDIARALIEAARNSDIIHVLTEPSAPFAMLIAMIARKPFVISAHGTYADIRSYPWYQRPFYWLAFRRAAAIVAVSRYTGEVVRRGYGRSVSDIVPGGFENTMNAPVGRSLGSPPQILSVGALKPRKGFHTLLKSLGILRRSGFDFRCRIIGAKLDAEYFSRLENLVIDNDLSGRVIFAHGVSDDALKRAYAEADLFVLPSEHKGTAFEGLGLVYLEALAMGTPVIGCRQSGAEDVIAEGVNGYLVNPASAEELAEAIRKILGNPETWARLSVQAPASVSFFAWDRVGGRMSEIYNRVCASKA